MRKRFLLVLALALLSSACSRTSSGSAPPAPNRSLLAGKWKNSSESQLISSYEFAENGNFAVSIRGMGEPVKGKFVWSDDRSLSLEYQITAEMQKAYEAAAKAYKDEVNDKIKNGLLPDRAGPSIMGGVRDKWPVAETFKISLPEKPPMLIVIGESGGSQTFDRVN